MTIYDISVSISNNMPVYPGDQTVDITPLNCISEGADANVSMIKMGSHTGTHVDPPKHFIDSGLTVDKLPLDVLVGECMVCEIPESSVIGIAELEAANIPPGTERILFKTKNSNLWDKPGFQEDYAYLDPKAAEWLVKRGVRLIGIDYLSIEGFHTGSVDTHLRLLEAGIILIEGLDLQAVTVGIYTLVCLPLKIEGGDGAPARAILIG